MSFVNDIRELEAYSHGQLQAAVQIMDLMDKYGLTRGDIIDAKDRIIQRKIKPRPSAPRDRSPEQKELRKEMLANTQWGRRNP